MTDDQEAKLGFIRAYFDELDRKIAVLPKLAATGFRDEALTLCLVYIDGLAQRLSWPQDRAGQNYVAVLAAFAADAEFGLIHPKQLVQSLDRMAAPWKTIASVLRTAFPGPDYELVTPAVVIDAVRASLTAAQLADLQREIWRGTIAGIAYFWMRNPAVHALGASSLTFSGSTVAGKPARALDLPWLLEAAKHLAAEARRRSESNGEWFGNDLVLS